MIMGPKPLVIKDSAILSMFHGRIVSMLLPLHSKKTFVWLTSN